MSDHAEDLYIFLMERGRADVDAKWGRIMHDIALNAKTAYEAGLKEANFSSSDTPITAYWRGQDWVCRKLALQYTWHPGYKIDWRPYGGTNDQS